MVNWKFILIGAGLVIVLGWFIGKIAHNTFLGVIISGVIVGFLVNDGYKNGAVNGFIAVFIGELIEGILLLVMIPPLMVTILAYPGIEAIFAIILWEFVPAVFYAILGAIGGIVGSFIKSKYIEYKENNPTQ